MTVGDNIKDLLKDYMAPLEDNYGTTTYNAVLDSLAQMIPPLVEDGRKFIWRITWMVDKKKVHAFYSQECSQESMEKECEVLAAVKYKRPVLLEKLVTVKEWK